MTAMACEQHPQIYSVKSVDIPELPDVVFTRVPRTQHFAPSEVRRSITTMFEYLKPSPNANRGRLSNVAVSLTFGAQTGRGSDRSCVIRRTLEPVCNPRFDFKGPRDGTECSRSSFAISRNSDPKT